MASISLEHPFDFLIVQTSELPHTLFGEGFGKAAKAIERFHDVLVEITIQRKLAQNRRDFGIVRPFS